MMKRFLSILLVPEMVSRHMTGTRDNMRFS